MESLESWLKSLKSVVERLTGCRKMPCAPARIGSDCDQPRTPETPICPFSATTTTTHFSRCAKFYSDSKASNPIRKSNKQNNKQARRRLYIHPHRKWRRPTTKAQVGATFKLQRLEMFSRALTTVGKDSLRYSLICSISELHLILRECDHERQRRK